MSLSQEQIFLESDGPNLFHKSMFPLERLHVFNATVILNREVLPKELLNVCHLSLKQWQKKKKRVNTPTSLSQASPL